MFIGESLEIQGFPIGGNVKHVESFKPSYLDSPSRIHTKDACTIISSSFKNSVLSNMTRCVVAPSEIEGAWIGSQSKSNAENGEARLWLILSFASCLIAVISIAVSFWKPINRWYTAIESSSTHCAYIALLPTLAHHTSSFQHKIYFQYLNSRLPTSRFLCTNYCESELTLDVLCVEMVLK